MNAKQKKAEIKKVASKVIYSAKVISIRQDTVYYMDGRLELHEILQAPQGVLILPVTQKGTIILTKEYRYNHGWVYAVPMGKMEKGETDPVIAAKRELKEEIGITATNWACVSTHHNGIHEEGLNYFFVAQGLSYGEHKHDTDEDIEKAEMTFEDAFKLMDEGKIVDLRSRGCIWAGYIYLLRKGKQKR